MLLTLDGDSPGAGRLEAQLQAELQQERVKTWRQAGRAEASPIAEKAFDSLSLFLLPLALLSLFVNLLLRCVSMSCQSTDVVMAFAGGKAGMLPAEKEKALGQGVPCFGLFLSVFFGKDTGWRNDEGARGGGEARPSPGPPLCFAMPAATGPHFSPLSSLASFLFLQATLKC